MFAQKYDKFLLPIVMDGFVSWNNFNNENNFNHYGSYRTWTTCSRYFYFFLFFFKNKIIQIANNRKTNEKIDSTAIKNHFKKLIAHDSRPCQVFLQLQFFSYEQFFFEKKERQMTIVFVC